MERVYEYLGLPFYQHDFNNVEQVTFEDDSVHGLDLHTIRSKVEPVKDDSEEILGKSLCKKLDGTEFWRI